jgi:hypothetical protein
MVVSSRRSAVSNRVRQVDLRAGGEPNARALVAPPGLVEGSQLGDSVASASLGQSLQRPKRRRLVCVVELDREGHPDSPSGVGWEPDGQLQRIGQEGPGVRTPPGPAASSPARADARVASRA